MTATFLLSFAMGACEIIGGTDRIVTDAFGVVALVAMTPLITIPVSYTQLDVYKRQSSRFTFDAEWNAPLPIINDPIASVRYLMPDYCLLYTSRCV